MACSAFAAQASISHSSLQWMHRAAELLPAPPTRMALVTWPSSSWQTFLTFFNLELSTFPQFNPWAASNPGIFLVSVQAHRSFSAVWAEVAQLWCQSCLVDSWCTDCWSPGDGGSLQQGTDRKRGGALKRICVIKVMGESEFGNDTDIIIQGMHQLYSEVRKKLSLHISSSMTAYLLDSVEISFAASGTGHCHKQIVTDRIK